MVDNLIGLALLALFIASAIWIATHHSSQQQEERARELAHEDQMTDGWLGAKNFGRRQL
jgi:hypothetical protein